MKILRLLLSPLSLLYGCIVYLRNSLYEMGILPSKEFDVPIISVGNISAGGTGKSPHIEYLIRLMQPLFSVATLSRGYKRITSGFVIAEIDTEVYHIGDEPKQFKQNFNEITVAVDKDRVNGIQKLIGLVAGLNVILLDDAYQHRAVKPGMNILVTDYSKLYISDYLLPTGYLREWRSAAKRADIIIVSKTPAVFSPLERRIIKEKLKPKPWQQIFFSYIRYGDFIPINNNRQSQALSKDYYFSRKYHILLITGIAKPSSLLYFLKQNAGKVIHIKFPDHHCFTQRDIEKIKRKFDTIVNQNKIILTTQKDAVRLSVPGLQDAIGELPVFYVPIEVVFHEKDKEIFNEQIINYVGKNQSNGSVHQRKS